MSARFNATGRARAGRDSAPVEPLLDVRDVASLLRNSTRSVYRLTASGRLPRPLKIGALNRWSRAAVMGWLQAGCPRCKGGGR
jgi:excisionase family DNA binding protein